MLQMMHAVYTACFGVVILKVTSRSNYQVIKYLGATSGDTGKF